MFMVNSHIVRPTNKKIYKKNVIGVLICLTLLFNKTTGQMHMRRVMDPNRWDFNFKSQSLSPAFY